MKKCRLCEEYGWDDPQDVLEGKDYCVFHAPKDEKGMRGIDFINLFRKRIRKSQNISTPIITVNYDGLISPPSGPDINIVTEYLPDSSFKSAIFYFSLRLSKIKFGKNIIFSKAQFHEGIICTGSEFYGEVDFQDAKFYKRIDFRRVTFNGLVFFGDAIFYGPVYFNDASFLEFIDFEDLQFLKVVSFYNVNFEKEVLFWRTSFSKDVSFKSTKFHSRVEFIETSFDVAKFDNAVFKKHVRFELIPKLVASFSSVFIEEDMVFKNIEELDVWFPYAKMDNIRFEDCGWKTENDKKGGRICVSLEDENLTQAEDFYRRMKQKYKNENNEGEASRWHLAEKEVYRKRLREDKESLFLRAVLFLYRWSSGYGEDPWRAFFVLLSVILLPFLYFFFAKSWIMNLSFLPDGGACKAILQSVYSFFPLTKVDQSVLEGNVFELAIRPFWKLLVAAQAALLAFALRNKFRR